ncbi:unnamed protein product [Musa acuminata subsp. malaccensis]|uniref:(wild Malaysian banana) hypothetical protein n=1 Tax=Musa acuminata subsp. malaccensis TaxID=214687 RepID=A0A8D7B5A4_MUSAM|nr:unnamed protein product [Musa acuminata subsp. malaccensis]
MSDMDVDRHMNQNAETAVPSSQQEEEAVKKKDGGILPKKTTSHIRGWALGKVSLSAHTKLFRAKTRGNLLISPKNPLRHSDQSCSPHHICKYILVAQPMHTLIAKREEVLLQRIPRMTMLTISDFKLPIPSTLSLTATFFLYEKRSLRSFSDSTNKERGWFCICTKGYHCDIIL